MSAINEVLHRRSDLATFVVHFTRRTPTSSAEENLVQMLVNGCIEARTPMGWARGIAERAGPAAVDSQKVVCFSEAPLEHLYSLTADINGRRIALEPYGIAFTKMVVRRRGANPVWYVDMSYGHDWKLARPSTDSATIWPATRNLKIPVALVSTRPPRSSPSTRAWERGLLDRRNSGGRGSGGKPATSLSLLAMSHSSLLLRTPT